LNTILEELESLVEEEIKYRAISDNLDKFRNLIDENRVTDNEFTCSSYRQLDNIDYWFEKYKLAQRGIDLETYRIFLELNECICGFCSSVSQLNYSFKPKNSLNVVIFDEDKHLYRDEIHDFILCKKDHQIQVVGILDNDIIRPLTNIEINMARSLGLLIESV
jgi:Zn-dependent oligopeptidase